MTFTIIGYYLNPESQAITAKEDLRVYYEIPVDGESETRQWVDYSASYTEEGEVDFYYIIWDESLNVILGEPIELEINNGIDEL